MVRQALRTAFYFIPSAMTGFIVSVFPFRNRVSFKEAFEGLELGEGKPSRPVLRGPGGRKAAWLLGNYSLGVCAIPLLNSEFQPKQLKSALLKGRSDHADIQVDRGNGTTPRCRVCGERQSSLRDLNHLFHFSQG